MPELSVQSPTLGGIAPGYTAADVGGDYFLPTESGKYLVHVKNGHTASQTVTINDPNSVVPPGAKSFDPDVDVAVPNAAERMFVVDVGRFKHPTTGKIELAYSGITALTIGVFKV